MKRVPTTRPLRFNEASTYYPPWDLMKLVPIICPLGFNEASTYYPTCPLRFNEASTYEASTFYPHHWDWDLLMKVSTYYPPIEI